MRGAMLFFLYLCAYANAVHAKPVHHEAYIGGHVNGIRLKRSHTPNLEGYQSGVAFSYEVQKNRLFAQGVYEGYWTDVNAIGELGARSALSEQLTELRLGFSVNLCGVCCLKPYTGVGYDYYKDLQQPQDTPLPTRFKKIFIPVGLLIETPVNRDILIGGRIEWRPVVYSKAKLGSNDSSLESHLELTDGIRLEAPITFFLPRCHRFKMQLIPFADWNRWGRAKETSSLGVPFPIYSQKNRILGLRLLFGMCY